MKGAAANDLGLPPVPADVKARRQARFMERQQAISAANLKRKVGRRLPVLIDQPGNGGVAKGRSKADAPEIDGAVYVTGRRPLRAGDLVTVLVERADAHDLYGRAV